MDHIATKNLGCFPSFSYFMYILANFTICEILTPEVWNDLWTRGSGLSCTTTSVELSGKLRTYELYDFVWLSAYSWWLEKMAFCLLCIHISKNFEVCKRIADEVAVWHSALLVTKESWELNSGKWVDFHCLATFEIDTCTLSSLGHTFLDPLG